MKNAHIVQVRDAGQKDDTDRKLKECICTELPARREDLSQTLRPYWQIKDDVAIVYDIILFGQRMLIPLVMRKHVMEALHVSHQGQLRTLQRAQQTRYTGQTSRRTFVQGWRSVSVGAYARPPSLTSRLLWKAIYLVLLKVLQPIFSAWRERTFGLSWINTRDGQSSHYFNSTALSQLMLFGQ